jgi:hypothetical protein
MLSVLALLPEVLVTCRPPGLFYETLPGPVLGFLLGEGVTSVVIGLAYPQWS